MSKAIRIAAVIFLLSCWVSKVAYAHQSSTSFLHINAPQTETERIVTARWKIAVLDLEVAIALDDNHDGEIVWGEILANSERIKSFANTGITIQQNQQKCKMSLADVMIEKLNSGLFLVADLLFYCDNRGPFVLRYSPMAGIDNAHLGIVNYKAPIGDSVLIFDDNNTVYELPYRHKQGQTRLFHFIAQGIWHILIGIDHILFLLALLMPSVLEHKQGRWVIQHSLSTVIKDVIKIVTTFTVAHTVTLIAASMQWITLASGFVEIVIAISVAITGLMIFFPIRHGYHLGFVFVFGLIHGFGFANVLRDLMVSQPSFLVGTLGFNVGVEIGQLLIVIAVLPALYFCRSHLFYRRLLMPVGGGLIIVTGAIWAVERSLI